MRSSLMLEFSDCWGPLSWRGCRAPPSPNRAAPPPPSPPPGQYNVFVQLEGEAIQLRQVGQVLANCGSTMWTTSAAQWMVFSAVGGLMCSVHAEAAALNTPPQP